MRPGTFYCACNELPRSFFGWVVCVIRTHNWEVLKRYPSLQEAEVGCRRCGQAQWLEDVPSDWDLQFCSRRFDPLIALLTLSVVIVPIVVASLLIFS